MKKILDDPTTNRTEQFSKQQAAAAAQLTHEMRNEAAQNKYLVPGTYDL